MGVSASEFLAGLSGAGQLQLGGIGTKGASSQAALDSYNAMLNYYAKAFKDTGLTLKNPVSFRGGYNTRSGGPYFLEYNAGGYYAPVQAYNDASMYQFLRNYLAPGGGLSQQELAELDAWYNKQGKYAPGYVAPPPPAPPAPPPPPPAPIEYYDNPKTMADLLARELGYEGRFGGEDASKFLSYNPQTKAEYDYKMLQRGGDRTLTDADVLRYVPTLGGSIPTTGSGNQAYTPQWLTDLQTRLSSLQAAMNPPSSNTQQQGQNLADAASGGSSSGGSNTPQQNPSTPATSSSSSGATTGTNLNELAGASLANAASTQSGSGGSSTSGSSSTQQQNQPQAATGGIEGITANFDTSPSTTKAALNPVVTRIPTFSSRRYRGSLARNF